VPKNPLKRSQKKGGKKDLKKVTPLKKEGNPKFPGEINTQPKMEGNFKGLRKKTQKSSFETKPILGEKKKGNLPCLKRTPPKISLFLKSKLIPLKGNFNLFLNWEGNLHPKITWVLIQRKENF